MTTTPSNTPTSGSSIEISFDHIGYVPVHRRAFRDYPNMEFSISLAFTSRPGFTINEGITNAVSNSTLFPAKTDAGRSIKLAEGNKLVWSWSLANSYTWRGVHFPMGPSEEWFLSSPVLLSIKLNAHLPDELYPNRKVQISVFETQIDLGYVCMGKNGPHLDFFIIEAPEMFYIRFRIANVHIYDGEYPPWYKPSEAFRPCFNGNTVLDHINDIRRCHLHLLVPTPWEDQGYPFTNNRRYMRHIDPKKCYIKGVPNDPLYPTVKMNSKRCWYDENKKHAQKIFSIAFGEYPSGLIGNNNDLYPIQTSINQGPMLMVQGSLTNINNQISSPPASNRYVSSDGLLEFRICNSIHRALRTELVHPVSDMMMPYGFDGTLFHWAIDTSSLPSGLTSSMIWLFQHGVDPFIPHNPRDGSPRLTAIDFLRQKIRINDKLGLPSPQNQSHVDLLLSYQRSIYRRSAEAFKPSLFQDARHMLIKPADGSLDSKFYKASNLLSGYGFGKALIISGHSMKTELGTEWPLDAMKNWLDDLHRDIYDLGSVLCRHGFDVEYAIESLDFIGTISRINLDKCDTFLCFIITHGDLTRLQQADTTLIDRKCIREEICKRKELMGKPKITVIAACRGLDAIIDRANTHTLTSPVPAYAPGTAIPEGTPHGVADTLSDLAITTVSNNLAPPIKASIANYTIWDMDLPPETRYEDQLEFHSAPAGFLGSSQFVKTFITTFRKYALKKNFSHIFHKLMQTCLGKTTISGKERIMFLPELVSRLRLEVRIPFQEVILNQSINE